MESTTYTQPTLKSIKNSNACAHCGEDCGNHPIQQDQTIFCCEGCKMVYQVLHDNDLCQFYTIDEKAAFSLKGKRLEGYTYLDSPEIVQQLVDYVDDKQVVVRFHLPQIHCASCIWLLEHLYRLAPGIQQSQVQFVRKEIALHYDPQQINLRQVVELLASIGYAPTISLESTEQTQKHPIDRKLYFQLGIAGFAFGNIMLMSFPEYLGMQQHPDHSIVQLFGYLNILLALPVLLYSGGDYLRSAFLGLRHFHLNMDVPISLGMLALFTRSSYEILSGIGAGYMDSLAGFVFFLLIGKWFQQRTYQHLSFERDFRSYFPIAATVMEEGEERIIPVRDLQVGQVIRIRHGELIPADGKLVEGRGLIDYSFVTGEAQAVRKVASELLFAGGRQVGGAITVKIRKLVDQSYLTSLWNDQAFKKDVHGQTSRLADRVAQYFTVAILAVAAGTLFYWLPIDCTIAINAFSSVLIIACPCAVALSVPFTFGNSMHILAKQGFFLKNVETIESLSEIDTIVFDKTGTLTDSQNQRIDYEGIPLGASHQAILYQLASESAHPVSRQLSNWLIAKLGRRELEQVEEIVGEGIRGFFEGQEIRLGRPSFVGSTPGASNAAFSHQTCWGINGEILGSFTIQSSYRRGMEDVLRSFSRRYQPYLLTGDNDRDRLRLEPLFHTPEHLLFDQRPVDKLRFVEKLRAEGKKVLMIGDGLNDAGALQASNSGIVLSEDTTQFTPASDAILSASQFARLGPFLQFARGNIRLVHAAYGLALIYNIIGLSFAVQGSLAPVVAAILMPASSITIVVFGVLSSNWLARKLGIS
ncbi:MAG: heavy metal translocating P-type ATPase metal-binding domain-containing protein [Bacteroidota bacterium]